MREMKTQEDRKTDNQTETDRKIDKIKERKSNEDPIGCHRRHNGDSPLRGKRPQHQRAVVEDVHVGGMRGQRVSLPRGPGDGGGRRAFRQARQHHARPGGEHHSAGGRDGEAWAPSSAAAHS